MNPLSTMSKTLYKVNVNHLGNVGELNIMSPNVNLETDTDIHTALIKEGTKLPSNAASPMKSPSLDASCTDANM